MKTPILVFITVLLIIFPKNDAPKMQFEVVEGKEPVIVIKQERIIEKKKENKLSKVYDASVNPEVQQIIEEVASKKGWIEHIDSWKNLVAKESGFNPYAVNISSGACGIGQALPCEKMQCDLGDVQCQATWMATYIQGRYGDPTRAWEFWLSKKPINGIDVGHWY